jgi:hypothetical protein
VFGGLGAVLLLVVVAGGWLVWTGLQARAELGDARAATTQLRAALVRGDARSAGEMLAGIVAHADRARDLTSGPVWDVAGAVPYVGRSPAAVTRTAEVVDGLAHDVLPGIVDMGRRLSPASLRTGDQIDVTALAVAAPAVTRLDGLLQQAAANLAAIDLGGVPGPVSSGVLLVSHQVTALGSELDAARTATRLLPAMLGANTPRRYLVVFQNNAESRATGGLVGAFGVLEAVKGKLAMIQLGSDAELRSAAAPVVDLGPAYAALFGSDPALWPNTNLSAHFPYAAVQQLELWRRQFGTRLDGVIATDPVALGYLLTAAGPATLPGGERLTGAGVADLTMREVYARYALPSQVAQRKAFLQVVAQAALTRILGGGGAQADAGAQAELTALGRAAGERRLLVYSVHPDEERQLAGTALGGVVDAAPGPYAGVAVDNASGSKVDYYLGVGLAYTLGPCPGTGSTGPSATRASTISVTLHDGAPATGLPAYAGYRLDLGTTSSAAGRGGDGSVRDTVLVYAAAGSRLVGATLDGVAVSVTPGLDGAAPGRPVYLVSVVLAAGQSRTLRLSLAEPSVPLPARTWLQAFARTGVSTVQASTCR